MGANATRARPIHLFITSKSPMPISSIPRIGKYPALPSAPINSAASPSIGGIGKKCKNLFSPKTNNIKPNTRRNIIVIFEFINN